jgi:hypothetical protein
MLLIFLNKDAAVESKPQPVSLAFVNTMLLLYNSAKLSALQ